MKAMVFAAGLGTRLRPFTLHHPKALAPVAGVPMLQRVILKLKDAGITEMVVNVHHFADQIIDFLRDNDNFGVDIHISDESSCLLDTGGGILAARRWLDDSDFIVHNADILTDFPVDEMIHSHLANHPDATLLVADRSTSRYLLMDDDMRMHGWINKSTGETRPQGLSASGMNAKAFGGVHILSPAVFPSLEAYAEAGDVFSIMNFYIDTCTDHTYRGFTPESSYNWLDVGKPESLEKANALFIKQ